jgi:hypothetical protein
MEHKNGEINTFFIIEDNGNWNYKTSENINKKGKRVYNFGIESCITGNELRVPLKEQAIIEEILLPLMKVIYLNETDKYDKEMDTGKASPVAKHFDEKIVDALKTFREWKNMIAFDASKNEIDTININKKTSTDD